MRLRQILLIVAIAAAFGVLAPYYKGFGILDRRLVVAYGCLAAIFAAPVATEAFADLPANPLRTMVRVWLLAWGYALVIFALALWTVNLRSRYARPILPPVSFLVAVECFGLTLSACLVGLSAHLARRWGSGRTLGLWRTVFLVIIAAFFLSDRYAPPLKMSIASLTRLLFILSGICGAVALVLAARYPDPSPEPLSPEPS